MVAVSYFFSLCNHTICVFALVTSWKNWKLPFTLTSSPPLRQRLPLRSRWCSLCLWAMPTGALLWPQLSEGRLGDLGDLKLEMGNGTFKQKWVEIKVQFDYLHFSLKLKSCVFGFEALGNHFLQMETEMSHTKRLAGWKRHRPDCFQARRLPPKLATTVDWGW